MNRRTSVSALAIAIVIIGFAVAFSLFQGASRPPVQTAVGEKFQASGYFADSDAAFLFVDAGKDRGIWAKNGLDPEFVTIQGRAILASDLKQQIASGIKIGINVPTEVLLARSSGAPVRIVAGYIGEAPSKVFVKADSSIKTPKDLDGKKIGVFSTDHFTYRQVLYLSSKFGIKPEAVPIGDLPSNIAALKTGRIDAFLLGTPNSIALLLVDSGELRILLHMRDVLPKPFVSLVVFATEDLIDQNPDLVNRFVKASLEVVRYLKENPNYAIELYMKKTGADKDLAGKAIPQLDWTPNGRGSGQDLAIGVANTWQYNKESGAIPASINVKIEDAVSSRFLP